MVNLAAQNPINNVNNIGHSEICFSIFGAGTIVCLNNERTSLWEHYLLSQASRLQFNAISEILIPIHRHHSPLLNVTLTNITWCPKSHYWMVITSDRNPWLFSPRALMYILRLWEFPCAHMQLFLSKAVNYEFTSTQKWECVQCFCYIFSSNHQMLRITLFPFQLFYCDIRIVSAF